MGRQRYIRARNYTKKVVIILMAVVVSSWQLLAPLPVAHADFSSPAFPCDGSFYQVRTPGSTANTSLYKLILDQTGNYSEQEIGPLSQSFTGMNGLGYNPADGLLYAFSTAANGGINYHLYSINDTGTVTDVGLVSGLSDSGGKQNISGATFRQDGKMYVMHSDGSNSMIRLSTVDLSTMTATYVTLSEAVPQGDLAIDPTSGLLYGVDAGANQPLRIIDPVTGNVSHIGSTSKVNGSAFFDASGNLYASGNSSGNIYSIDKTTGVYTIIATGPAASSSDGASCAFSPRQIDNIKSVTSSSHISGNTYQVSYEFGVKNTGSTDVDDNIQVIDNLTQTFTSGSPTIAVTAGPTVTSGSCTANGSYDGSSDIALLSGTDDLAVGASCTITLTVEVTYPNPASVPGTAQNNQAYASSSAQTVNPGHRYVDDGNGGYVIVPPTNLQAGDTSTNATSFPGTPGGDTPSTTPVTFSTSPVVTGYKSVAFTDNNGNGTVNPGDTLTYTVTYRNTGNASETNFQVTDSIPAGTTYVGGSLTVTPSGVGQLGSANPSFNGTSSTSLLAAPVTLEYDGMIVATFSVTINSGTVGSLANQASGDGDSIAPLPTDALDNSASGDCHAPSGVSVPSGSVAQSCTAAADDQTTVTATENDATITVTKTDGVTTVEPGDTLTYTITVANPTADSNATNLSVSDTLPAGTTFVSASNGGTETSGVVTWSIASLAGGANVTRTVTVTVNSNVSDGTVLTNTATASSSSDTGLCGRSGSSCTGTDNNTVVDVPANVFDPPSGYKTYDANGLPVLHWKMVWINDANSGPERVRIVDPLDSAAPYVAGSLVCTPRGSSTTASCTYDSGSNSVIWEGVIGADPGATDEASATNEVVIELDVRMPAGLSSIENQALAYWDENGDDAINNSDANVATDTPVLTANGASTIEGIDEPTVFTASELASTGVNFPVIICISMLMLIAGSALSLRSTTNSRRTS
jgi:uncharacterized repeat protein (TIGR01451 family)